MKVKIVQTLFLICALSLICAFGDGGAPIKIKARNVVKFKAGKNLTLTWVAVPVLPVSIPVPLG